MKRIWIQACVPALLMCLLVSSASARQPKPQATDIAADAYVYGFPLVLMELTREKGFSLGYQLNCFNHDRNLKTPANKAVVRPNNDTLYSTSFVDLTAGPLVLHVPDTAGRYYLLQILDGWTNTFASPGSRTTGSAEQDFILAGPDWRGPLRGNTPVYRSPTNHVWILGRTEVKQYADPVEQAAEMAAVHAIQDQFSLTPLRDWLQGERSTCYTENVAMSSGATPVQQLLAMSGVELLQKLSDLMRATPAAGWDRPALKRFEAIGFSPGEPYSPPAAMQADINAAKPVALQRIGEGWLSLPEIVNGWGVVLTEIGTFGTDYLKRASVDRYGLGANLLADAIYPTAYRDGTGAPLDASKHNYRIHFPAGELPPVQGFWSIALYQDNYLFPNPLERYAIHGTDPLQSNADGSVDLYIQADPPDDPALLPNWLPAPQGPFNLTLRMYWPDKSALKGSWVPAPIEP